MKRSWVHVASAVVAVASLPLLTVACSSSNDPPSAEGGDGAKVSNEADGCFKDGERLAKDDTARCCEGLFKHCPSVSTAGDKTPCSCSAVECGTKANPPPPNVRCCPGVAERCESIIGSNQTTCVCGDPGQ